MTATAPITSGGRRTEEQEKQFKRLVEDAVSRGNKIVLKEVNPDKEGFQRIFNRGDELVARAIDAMVSAAREFAVSNKYENEEVKSSFTYPLEYKGAESITKQVGILAAKLDLSIDENTGNFIADVLPTLALPEGMEWFAFPSVKAVAAKHFPEITDPAEQYCKAVAMILEKLGKSRSFYNYREDEINVEHLRRSIRTVAYLERLAETQTGNFFIVPVNFGLKHRGKSVRRVREILSFGEFGLGAFEVGCMILTHPERFVRWEQLHTDCTGDEATHPGGEDPFSRAPFFRWRDGRLGFDFRWTGFAFDQFGSVVAVLPQ
jgi:hypothetical protein